MQTLDSHLGKVVRIERDGKVPADNPFAKQAGALPEIWSLRAPQRAGRGAASADRRTVDQRARRRGRRRTQPHARRAQLRLADGHATVSSTRAPRSATRTEAPGIESPVHYWVPSIATSGLAFYTGDAIPAVERQRVCRRARRQGARATRTARRQGRARGAAARWRR